MINRKDPIVIAVPARNEAARLPALLAGLAAQRGAPDFTLCLFLDLCEDDSVATLASIVPGLPYAVKIRSESNGVAPNAGLARRRAADFATAALADGILLSTDADSVPSLGWIAANIAALEQADVISGRIIRRDGSSPLQDRLEAYYDRLYRLRRIIDPVPWEDAQTHHWTSGASLAMTVATYRALDGFPAIPEGEDAALVDRANCEGWRVRRDGRVVVRTSARRRGRASQGFAAALSALDSPDAMPSLAHPEDEAWRYRHHARARNYFAGGKDMGLAKALGLSETEIVQVAAEVRNGEAFAARIVGAPCAGMRMVSLAFAEVALAGLETPFLAGVA